MARGVDVENVSQTAALRQIQFVLKAACDVLQHAEKEHFNAHWSNVNRRLAAGMGCRETCKLSKLAG